MKKIYIILLLSTLGFSCQDVIDIELPLVEKDKLVVDGVLLRDSFCRVQLTRSMAYDDISGFPTVQDAQITLTEGNVTDTLKHIGNGWYEGTLIKGKTNSVYTLTIKTSKDSTSATAILPRGPQFIDSIYFNDIPFLPPTFTSRTITNLWVQEPVGTGDNYLFRFYKNDTLQTRPESIDIRDDQFVDGVLLKDITVGVLLKKGDKAKVEIHSITRDCYDYYFQIINNTLRQGSIFNPPPATLKTNMSNGALGYFRVSAMAQIEGIVP